jgi:hypothetical protein
MVGAFVCCNGVLGGEARALGGSSLDAACPILGENVSSYPLSASKTVTRQVGMVLRTRDRMWDIVELAILDRKRDHIAGIATRSGQQPARREDRRPRTHRESSRCRPLRSLSAAKPGCPRTPFPERCAVDAPTPRGTWQAPRKTEAQKACVFSNFGNPPNDPGVQLRTNQKGFLSSQ